MSAKTSEPMTQDLEESTNELKLYAQDVIDEMVYQNVPPTPSNFDTYFNKMLEDRSSDFKNRILKILELESKGEHKYQTMMEQHLKDAFVNIKKFMQLINLIYKNLRRLLTLIEKRRYELGAVSDKTGIMALLNALENDMRSMNKVIKKESKAIKDTYEATNELANEVQELAIYDNRFGVYKKKYFMHKVKQEIKLMKEFRHESSIMMIRTSKELLEEIKSGRVRQVILKTIARLLVKASHRNDLIAIYDDDVFVILMCYTSIQNAKKTAEKLKELVNNANFFVEDSEIELDVDIGISRIDLKRSLEATLACALEATTLCEKSSMPYGICPQDEEV